MVVDSSKSSFTLSFCVKLSEHKASWAKQNVYISRTWNAFQNEKQLCCQCLPPEVTDVFQWDFVQAKTSAHADILDHSIVRSVSFVSGVKLVHFEELFARCTWFSYCILERLVKIFFIFSAIYTQTKNLNGQKICTNLFKYNQCVCFLNVFVVSSQNW